MKPSDSFVRNNWFTRGANTLAQVYGREATTRWHKVCTCYYSSDDVAVIRRPTVARSIRGRVMCNLPLGFFLLFASGCWFNILSRYLALCNNRYCFFLTKLHMNIKVGPS
jgi:hypothetical protein